MYIPKNILYGLALSAVSLGAAVASVEDEWDYTHNYVEDGIVEDLTFGAHGNVWSKDHRHIAGWTISGEGYQPELMSDRIILTPPYPGNKRGGIWAQHPETHDEWEAEFEFRATGPERGSGNLQMWFARDPERDVKLSSIYTVGHFDGLVLTIGQYGGHGTLRAFLNDGSVSFKDHHHVDQMSFASCDFNYRNLGHFSHIMVKQTPYTFEVEIDHVSCFRTHKIHLPHGYYFGLTAASAENPDSFETRSFIVHKLKEGKRIESPGHGKHPEEKLPNDHDHWAEAVQHHYKSMGEAAAATEHHTEHTDHGSGAADHHDYSDYHQDDRGWYWTSESSTPKDAPASSFKTEEQRFEDLHTRITQLNHQLDILFHDLTSFKQESEERQRDLKHYIFGYAEAHRHTLEKIEAVVDRVQKDIEGKDYQPHFDQLHATLQEGNQAVLLNMPHAVHSMVQAANPRMSFFVFIVIASQVMLLISWAVYKRRMKNQPKKYL